MTDDLCEDCGQPRGEGGRGPLCRICVNFDPWEGDRGWRKLLHLAWAVFVVVVFLAYFFYGG